MFKNFLPGFWQKPAIQDPKKILHSNPNYNRLDESLRGKPKSELAVEFSQIGMTDKITVAVKPIHSGGKVTLATFGEIKDHMIYVGRLAKNFGTGPKGAMHAFTEPNP